MKIYIESKECNGWVNLTDYTDKEDFLEFCGGSFIIKDAEDAEGFEKYYSENDIEEVIFEVLNDFGLSCDKCFLDLHNEYIGGDDYVYINDEDFLNECFSTPDKAVRAVYYGDYRYMDEYVKFNGYGNLESANDPFDFIHKSEVIEAIINTL